MTIIINSVWGGRVTQIIDRQIGRKISNQLHEVIDSESNKACVILTKNALATISYTSVAINHETWLDCVIANCLAHRKLDFAMFQPGSLYLSRPIHNI